MLQTALYVSAALLGVVVVTAAIRLTRRRRRAMIELQRGFTAIASARTPRPVTTFVGGRIGGLARGFNELVPLLDVRLARLEEDRQLLAAVLEGMNEGVIAVDARRRLLFANDAASKLFALGQGSVGRMVAELVRSPRVQEAVDATLVGSGPHRVEIVVADIDARGVGGQLSLAVQGTALPGSPPPGAVLVFHDVTDLRRLERMRQDFVANASHELKTPLAAIKAYTETLLDGALHDDAVNTRFLGQIDEQVDRLNQLIQDLLSLARIEAGGSAFHHAPLRLGPVVREIVEAHRTRAEANGLRYEPDLPTGDGPLVRADEEAVRQILDNLIDNALKYTPEGGRVAVSCRMAPDRVAIEVVDTGIGIPRDDLPRVFERFYRVDKARSREMGGTGLGLSIVKNLVNTLGGQIAVESRPGQGSLFRVTLPRLDGSN
jgi:two-component system, OmpR family, phosphate regulon sensor histidine kinase PhoR